ncbi:hypothetical protein BKA70DRAFT_346234 [Coprinopsis sp. MPI-PUGE-AT-0042]|nr:hypothetical protein BKA70DRAFT_346234 [Coprinopsis sp. MPI-PUGE-AT-0042]
MLALAGVIVGHLLDVSDLGDGTARRSLIQHYRHHHHHDHIVRRADIVLTLDGALNFQDVDAMDPGTPGQAIGWTYGGIPYLPSVRQKHTSRMGTGNGLQRVLPGRSFSSSSSVAIQKSTRPPTARRECRPTHSERRRSSHLLHSLERPPQIDVSRSLAYASHVLEIAKSPVMERLSW